MLYDLGQFFSIYNKDKIIWLSNTLSSFTRLYYDFSSIVTLCNGILNIGMPNDSKPPIFTIIENTYKIVSGNTNAY